MRDGYTFSGWYTSDSTRVTDETVFILKADQTLYAQWNPNPYTISFDGNGGTPSRTSKVVTCGGTYGDLPTAVRPGYAFVGWFTSVFGKEKIMPNTEFTIAKDQTLYAHWTIGSYTVTFDGCGGVPTQTTKIVTFNNTYGPLPVASKNGCGFLWWYAEDPGKAITETTKVEISRDHTLYALWDVNTLRIDFGNGTVFECEMKYGEEIAYPGPPSKEGYTFIGWNTNVTLMPYQNMTISAKWLINKYTIIFDFGNGTSSQNTFTYDEMIVYPVLLERKGYTFCGWSPSPEKVPSYNINITAMWKENESSYSGHKEDQQTKNGGNTVGIVVGVTVPFFLLIIIILSVMAFLFVKKNNEIISYSRRDFELDKPLVESTENDQDYDNSTCTRIVNANGDEVNGEVIAGKTLNSLYKVYPSTYVRPSMKEALLKAKLSDDQAVYVCEACENAAHFAKEDGKLLEGFTEEDAAAIAMYTYDFGAEEFESNPYRIINKSLVGRNFNNLQKASGILYLVMTALRKLPRVTGMTLYRGVRSEVNMDKDHYYEGNTITWPALSSTSPDMKATKTFLAKEAKNKKAKGTLFIIEDGWGYDIQPYSLFPDETEILLEPERQFKVVSVIQGEGLTFINLQMLDTPLGLTKVFGEGK